MIYVIGEFRTGVVKIGRTNNPQYRLAELQTSNPRRLRLLLVVPGGSQVERALHAHFASKRVRGEWFDFGDEDAVSAVAGANVQVVEPEAGRPADLDRLLADLPRAFANQRRIATRDLVAALMELPDSPWSFESAIGGGKIIGALLGTQGVRPKVMMLAAGHRAYRGYEWADIQALLEA